MRPVAALRVWAGRVDRRVPLWLRLVAGALVLATVTLAGTGLVGSRLLRGYLIRQTGDQLALLAPRAERILTVRNPQQPPPPGIGAPDVIAYLVTSDGVPIAEQRWLLHGGPHDPRLPSDLTLPPGQRERTFTVRDTGHGDPWLVRVQRAHGPGGGYLVLAQNLVVVDRVVHRLVMVNLVAGLSALAMLAVATFWLVRLSLRPLRTIEETAEKIAAGDLSRRVPDRGHSTEIGRLGTAVNGMLDRIDTALAARSASEAAARRSESQLRRFAADASHELRTPITTIRGYAELYRQQRTTMSDVEADRIVGRIEDQARRMGGLVDDLLLLAHLDQRRPLRTDPLEWASLVADVVLDLATLTTDHPIELASLDGTDPVLEEPIMVTGDDERLRQVVTNLITNAVKHTPPDTPIEVAIGRSEMDGVGMAVLEVRDTGPGMTADQAAHAFERFYRAEGARASSGGGAGLGLAIVTAIVAAHGGRADLSTTPGEGTTIRVTLPLADGAPRTRR